MRIYTDTEQRIINCVKDHPGLSVTDVSKYTGLGRDCVRYTVGRLMKEGCIVDKFVWSSKERKRHGCKKYLRIPEGEQ